MKRATLDGEGGGTRGHADECGEALVQGGWRLRKVGIQIGRRLFELAQPVIDPAVQVNDVEVRLQQLDGRQKALSLETVLVQFLRPEIGRRHQRHAAPEQTLEQSRKDHGVGDVVHEELIEANYPGAGRHTLRNDLQRLRMLFDAGKFGVDVAHEMIEMAALGAPGQRCEEQVHEQRFAAPDASPKVKAAWRRRFARKPRHR